MGAPPEKTILVTGSNGFVAGLIVKLALAKGYKVRGTVRSESSGAKLKATFPEYAAQLSTTLVPDITVVEDYEQALDVSITEVIHCASPCSHHHLVNIRAELLDPAIGGAVTILNVVQKYSRNVRRVVTTASFASNLDVSKGLRGGYTYDEHDWNPMLYEEASTASVAAAYSASKALAERAQCDCLRSRVRKEQAGLRSCSPFTRLAIWTHVRPVENLDHLSQSTSALWALVDNEEIPSPDFMGFVNS
ncbi:hypothetical protein N0V82_007786 [Gnomoniopsis sp. IMI 355080]|nr:hypothetical protein N0V82_007786 [Gnomoniopsis sp. IMI 355080]